MNAFGYAEQSYISQSKNTSSWMRSKCNSCDTWRSPGSLGMKLPPHLRHFSVETLCWNELDVLFSHPSQSFYYFQDFPNTKQESEILKCNHFPLLLLLLLLLLLWPPLGSSGQSSWLQIRRPGFDSRHYQKKSSRSGTGSTQPREYKWGATW
jgi:hypothetical protein